MGCSIYNGSILPDLPDSALPYALILNGTDTSGNAQTILWMCSQPFTADGDVTNAFNYPDAATIAAYAADMTNYRWVQGQVVTTTVKGADYCRILGSLVWSSHDIYLRNVDPPVKPTWNSEDYPYLLIKRSNLSDALLGVEVPEYEAFYSAKPFVWRDIAAADAPIGWFGWQTEPLGAQFMNLTETDTGYTTTGWYIDDTYGQFGFSGVYSTITGPSYDPTAEVALAENIWANHEIVGAVNGNTIKANSWFELLCYEQGTVEEITVLAPTDVTVAGGGTYDQGTTADSMTCTAVSPDGGTLSYKWYKDGVVCGYTASCTPSTKTAGTFAYYCVVTNTKYGDKVTAQSETLTVTINAAEVEEETTVRKPVEVIGYVLKLCGVPCAELVAKMLSKVKRTAAQYLYGTSSDSGNIGLRSGDTVTYYDGAVLPALSVEGHPYMLMKYTESNVADSTPIATMWVLDTPCVRKATAPFNCTMTGSYKVYKWAREQTTIDEWAGLLGLVEGMTANEWCLADEKSGEDISFASAISFTWANFDVTKTDGTVYLSGTDPIPVSGIVGYSYNATVPIAFPILPEYDTEKFPYALMFTRIGCYESQNIAGNVVIVVLSEPINIDSDNIFRAEQDMSARYSMSWYSTHNSWYLYDETTLKAGYGFGGGNYNGVSGSLALWSNYDIYDANGNLHCAASDPIPVYE